MKRALWASCMALWASCIAVPALADGFKPLTRSEPVVRMVLQEANGEPFYGMVAVAGTAFDRRQDKRWPNTLKKVVYQPWQYSAMRLKFKKYSVNQIRLARLSVRLARSGLRPCGKVYWYHTPEVNPSWAKNKRISCTIGNHIFYSDKEK